MPLYCNRSSSIKNDDSSKQKMEENPQQFNLMYYTKNVVVRAICVCVFLIQLHETCTFHVFHFRKRKSKIKLLVKEKVRVHE